MKATNKLWSSAKVDEAIQSATVEANQYAEQLIGNISSISLEYVTALPTVGEGNIIYILSGTPNTLNVYNQSTSAFVTVGDLDVDMSTFYTKNEVDALLDNKANKDEVFDKVVNVKNFKAQMEKMLSNQMTPYETCKEISAKITRE